MQYAAEEAYEHPADRLLYLIWVEGLLLVRREGDLDLLGGIAEFVHSEFGESALALSRRGGLI